MVLPPPSSAADAAPRINAGRLWAGGLATAAVAALAAIVGILLARGVFDVAVLAPRSEGTWGDADTWTYAAVAALVALLATGLLQLLMMFSPDPLRFFRWVVALLTLVGLLAPIAAERTWPGVATGLINLALGVTIGTLLSGVARSATRPEQPGIRRVPPAA
jgi:hypothetical protein